MINDSKDLIIVGASGFGREFAWLVERINEKKPTWNLLGFLDDNSELIGKKIEDYEVLRTSDSASEYPDAWYVCAIGSSKIRKDVTEKLGHVKFATLMDPSVIISKRVSIGEGTIICAGNIITVDVEFGNHVIVNLDCTIGHGELRFLYKFHDMLQKSTSHYIVDADGSERLMLKYYEYLLKIKIYLKQTFNMIVLENIQEFPLNTDTELLDYYEKIAEKIESPSAASQPVLYDDRYYVRIFVNTTLITK